MTDPHRTIARARQAASPLRNQARFTAEEAEAMAKPHRPSSFLVCCIDSRFQPARALDYGPGVALEHRPIGCVIPPEALADADLQGRMAFRRLNDINNIVLVCHSDCGGCQAALKVPSPAPENGGDLHTVAAAVHRASPDIPRLGREYLAAERGDLRRAGDRLARDVGIASLQNLLGYKGRGAHATVGAEVKAGALNVMLLYYDLEKRGFEIYDARRAKWRQAADCALLPFGAQTASLAGVSKKAWNKNQVERSDGFKTPAVRDTAQKTARRGKSPGGVTPAATG